MVLKGFQSMEFSLPKNQKRKIQPKHKSHADGAKWVIGIAKQELSNTKSNNVRFGA
ncbi:hypothetical protein MTR_1g064440 [Medicago truncatula]|uniref:Uncharacterized protein n=1 Tax=Medicago truncatula TaxID=3880 RepID=A0A072VK95_MEDTR|nr:hypothetical protein MTR_1g064440 [Medicago truncatula]